MSFCSWRGKEHYRDHFVVGMYVCSECDNELFSSRAKYEHDTPWPAFKEPVHENSLKKTPQPGTDNAVKVCCGKCGNGLGHEFLNDRDDGGSRF